MSINSSCIRIVSVIFASIFLNSVYASSSLQGSTLSTKQSEWQMVSQSTASWLWMDIYEASLFVADSVNPSDLVKLQLLDDSVPLKLRLCYERHLTASQIVIAAEKTLPSNLNAKISVEIEKLHRRYRDVAKGDCYALEHFANGITQLTLNSRLLFSTSTQGFKKAYFGIWLGEDPLSDDLKQRLLARFL